MASVGRHSFPADSASVSLWRAPSSIAPRYCCSMSHWDRSTCACANKCRPNCASCTANSALPLFTPRTLYKQPVSSFVAEFVGGSNILRADLAKKAGGRGTEILSIRPEQIDVLACDVIPRDGCVGLTGTLANIQYQGANSRYEVDVGGQMLVAQFPSGKEPNGVAIGEPVQLAWLGSDAVRLDR